MGTRNVLENAGVRRNYGKIKWKEKGKTWDIERKLKEGGESDVSRKC